MDLYYTFLGIPPEEQPPNKYRLLGLAMFESKVDIIENMARQKWQWVRNATKTARNVPQDKVAELLNEIAQAKIDLRDDDKRQAYDRKLRDELASKRGDSSGAVSSRSGLSGWDSSGAGEPPSSSRSALFIGAEDSDAPTDIRSKSWDIESRPVEKPASTLLEDSQWIVGSSDGVQIRIRSAWVSRRHCRVQRVGGEWLIEDLGSTNGTFINGVIIDEKSPISGNDIITLGKNTRLPWPIPEECKGMDMRVYSIGRSPSCDYQLDDASVSQHHALLIVEGDSILLEDLDSLNGTRVASLDQRIKRCQVEPHVSVFFGRSKRCVEQILEKVTRDDRL